MIATGSATDVYDLLAKIALFAVNVMGWTLNKQTSDEIYLQSGTDYWSLKAGPSLLALSNGWSLQGAGTGGSWVNPGIGLRGNRGFAGGSAWNAQPNSAGGTSLLGVFNNTVVPEYVLLSDAGANYLHVLARRDASNWTMMVMGRLAKFSTWTGGAYFSARPLDNATVPTNGGHEIFRSGASGSSNLGTAVNADIDALTNAWQNSSAAVGSNRVLQCYDTFLDGGVNSTGPATWNGRTPMMPLMALLSRNVGNSSYSYSGQVRDVRQLVDATMTNGREFVVGGDTWKYVNSLAFKLIS